MEEVFMSGPELDLRPGLNSGLPGLNLGHRFKVDPAWTFRQCISENTKTSLNQQQKFSQQQGESERRKSIM